jgi:hypothetical protein
VQSVEVFNAFCNIVSYTVVNINLMLLVSITYVCMAVGVTLLVRIANRIRRRITIVLAEEPRPVGLHKVP